MNRFVIRAYSKKELALMYFPDTDNAHTAVNHLMAWINSSRFLPAKLEETGYRKSCKVFNPRQVRAIVDEFGEPEI